MRVQLIKLIQVAKRQLKLDEDTYRQMLTHATGKNSLREMSAEELINVKNTFKAKGFKPTFNAATSGIKRAHKPSGHRFPVVDKIKAIWVTMSKHGFVEDGGASALDAYVRRMTLRGKGEGIESVQFLTSNTAPAVLESLKNWHRREMVNTLTQRGIAIPTNAYGHVMHYDAIAEHFELFLRGEL